MSDDRGTNAVLALVQSLAPAVAYKESNLESNRKIWNLYAKDWQPDRDWVRKMADNLGDEWKDDANPLTFVGDEWSDRRSLDQVLEEFVSPFCPSGAVSGEIGCGGGRVAARVIPGCSQFHCFDISKEMLRRARESFSAGGIACSAGDSKDCIKYTLLESNTLPADLTDTFDFIYSFDCLPHCDLHTIFAYLKEMKRLLKPGCSGMIHTSNLLAPAGFARFAQQKSASVQGFCFVTPDAVRKLVSEVGLEMVKESVVGAAGVDNIYYNRDYLCVFKKA
mmetsp:Transcript_30919/g.49894  ORF Transcript_30919/g.49894 Transcript_30919/m.49894 type:complete len:278 (-) Transcript_30919:473-1306(-)